MSGNSRWRMDRHVPVASIVSMGLFVVIQTIAITITMTYAWTTMGNRLDAHGDRITTLEHTVTVLAPMSERMVKMETDVHYITDTLQEIKALLRQVPTRAAP